MPVCKFYMSGVCKFGSHCRNKHPDPWPGYLAQLTSQLPPRVEDNLSEDFKFFIPSPTVTTDKIFYSSDSDWDEEDAEGHNSSNIAIVPCERCGLLELKPLPESGERNLCDKCQEERRGSRVVGLDLEQQQEQEKKNKTRKGKGKRRKKKAPVVAQTVESDLLAFEGTPEGVKVYRLKEGSDNQVDIVSTNNNNRSESQSSQNSEKAPCVNISDQIFKSDLEEPPSEIVQSSEVNEEVSEGIREEKEPIVLDNTSLKHLVLHTGLLMIVVLYKSSQNWFCFIGDRVKSCLSYMKQAILNWWNSSGASKPGKYSRRRKIFK